MAEAKAVYDESAEALTKAQTAYMARLEAEALPLIQEKADEIKAQYEAGIDFKSLINKYSTDTTERNLNGDGYPFHPDSKLWPESFKSAAAALRYYQMEKLNELVDGWQADYEIETHPELLVY